MDNGNNSNSNIPNNNNLDNNKFGHSGSEKIQASLESPLKSQQNNVEKTKKYNKNPYDPAFKKNKNTKILLFVFIGLFLLLGLGCMTCTYSLFKKESVHLPNEFVLALNIAEEPSDYQGSEFQELFSGSKILTQTDLLMTLKQAAEDNRVQGLYLNIENPGWGLSDIEELKEAMKRFHDAGKWSKSFFTTGGEGFSGNKNYILAALAQEITMVPIGEVVLTDLSLEIPFYGKLMEKLGVNWYVERRKEHKNAPLSFTEKEIGSIQKESLNDLRKELKNLFRTFITEVRPKVSEESIQKAIELGTLFSDEAQAMGFVDKLEYKDQFFTRNNLCRKSFKKKEYDDKCTAIVGFEEYLNHAGRIDSPGIVSDKKVGVIIASGGIMSGPSQNNPMGNNQTIGSKTIVKQLIQARKDKIDALIFRVNSPGGSYIASDIIRRELELTKEAGIPIYISMSNYAASGGYFVSMEADKIYANATTLTGSIGVYSMIPNVQKLMDEHLGIHYDKIDGTPGGGPISLYFPMSDIQKNRFSRFVDRAYDDFVTKGAKGRQMDIETFEPLARGRVWTGRQAVAHKLIDGTKTFLEVLDQVKFDLGLNLEDKVGITYLREKKSTEEMLKEILAPGSNMQIPKAIQKEHGVLLELLERKHIGVESRVPRVEVY